MWSFRTPKERVNYMKRVRRFLPMNVQHRLRRLMRIEAAHACISSEVRMLQREHEAVFAKERELHDRLCATTEKRDALTRELAIVDCPQVPLAPPDTEEESEGVEVD